MAGNDNFTKLLIHANGTDASTTFTDDSPSSHSVTAVDNAQVDTAQSVFGGASALFDGTGDWLSIPDSDDWFFDGDFTIDFRVRWNGSPGATGFIGTSEGGGSQPKWGLYWGAFVSNTVSFHNSAGANVNFSWTPSGNTWYHIALVRNGNDWLFFVDGVQTGGTQVASLSLPNVASELRVGADGENFRRLNGWLDEIRISKGIARWVSNFTPPTSEYSDDSPINESELIDISDTAQFLVDYTNQENISINDSATINLATSQSEQENINVSDDSKFSINLNLNENINIVDNETIDIIGTISLNLNENITVNDSSLVEAELPPIRNISGMLHNNPLYLVTDTDPMQIIEVDISDPQNPTWTQHVINGSGETIRNAKDITIDTINSLLYVAGAEGQILELQTSDLNNRQQIDTGDTDDLLNISWHDDTVTIFSGTSESTGEIIVMDSEVITTFQGDLRLIEQITKAGQMGIDLVHAQTISGDIRFLAEQTVIGNMDIRFLSSAYDDIAFDLIGRPDFDVRINGVSVADVSLNTIIIRHDVDTESTATFTLGRLHDDLDKQLDGTVSEITNQNLVEIYIDGIKEFEGNISEINTGSESEQVKITAIGDCPTRSRTTKKLPMSLLNANIHPYDVMLHNPRIFNPVIDPNDENPRRFLGVKVDLGTQITQRVLRFQTLADTPVGDTSIFVGKNSQGFYNGFGLNISPVNINNFIFGLNNLGGVSLGTLALSITEGTFQPRQNWTYFWGPITAEDTTTGLENLALYVGTSLSGFTSKPWELLQVRYRYQRILDDIETGELTLDDPSPGFIQVSNIEDIPPNSEVTKKTEYFVGSAPFREISTRKGKLIAKPKWVDRENGLYEETDASYDYREYAKQIADLEFDKIKNINGSVLPETSADIDLTIDAYFYYRIKLLNRLNLSNTTNSTIYNNSNGFPVAVKTITIDSSTLLARLRCDNQLSQEEIDEIEDQFPDPLDFQTDFKSEFIVPKFDPARLEDVE